MSSGKQVEIQFEDPNPQKWCHPLKEEVFARLMSKENPSSVYKAGSFFSPFLFGKFFDPSDAFPLWEFEPDVLLPVSNTTQRNLNWYQTDTDYVLKAEIPAGANNIGVSVENGKILEISGQWKQQKEGRKKEWRSREWWEEGYVRRIELPDQQSTDWTKCEAHFKNDQVLEIKIPKNRAKSDTAHLG